MTGVKDGAWHANTPVRTVGLSRQWDPNAGRAVEHRVRCWRSRWTKWDGKRWINKMCVDFHNKRSSAERCGQKLARRWNRFEKEGRLDANGDYQT